MRNESDRHHVVVVATEGVPDFELSIPCEVFGTDRSDVAPDWYSFEVVAPTTGTRTAAGLGIPRGGGLAASAYADTIVIPACASIHEGAPPAVLEAVRLAYSRGARIVSLCSGAFILAEAGLLNGRRATTHWMHARKLATRYPCVEVDPKVLFVHDGVWTSAGSAAGLDLCLELVRQDHGAAIANEVARRIVTPPHRDGGQAQYIRRAEGPTAGAELADVMHWARATLDTVTVSGMAGHANVSGRTLHRLIQAQTGQAPRTESPRVSWRLDYLVPASARTGVSG